ncbi:hypothetical protein PVAP13_1NG139400 [Panicum virgatum]|uniref:Uncharacterized protein n=1 Tax=Panicum virgatum TaxID=38727 RepID=A0A8T0WM80_PANVG|nr:hypothetical protein PVAP13_1NG139400 [Panicum virgatum]
MDHQEQLMYFFHMELWMRYLRQPVIHSRSTCTWIASCTQVWQYSDIATNKEFCK